jgi:hypothetical protein
MFWCEVKAGLSRLVKKGGGRRVLLMLILSLGEHAVYLASLALNAILAAG